MSTTRSLMVRLAIYLVGVISLHFVTQWWWAAIVAVYALLFVAWPQIRQVLANTREPLRIEPRPLPMYDLLSYRHAVERKLRS